MQRKMKLGIVSTLLAVMMASIAYAWVASNTLTFTTTVSGSPILLEKSSDLPALMYYEEPFTFTTRTRNLASKAYSGCMTHFVISRGDGGAMQVSWVTVHYKDTTWEGDLTFTVDGSGNLVTTIGPWTATVGYDMTATITVTIHAGAAVGISYNGQVWVEVP